MKRRALWFLIAFALDLPADDGVGLPWLGCMELSGSAWAIAGLPGSAVARPAEVCPRLFNPWRIREDEAGVWLERVDAESGAVEERQLVEAGHAAELGVFADGTLVHFVDLGLGEVAEWQLVSADWMLVRAGEAWALVPRRAAQGSWFYLAPPPADAAPNEAGQ